MIPVYVIILFLFFFIFSETTSAKGDFLFTISFFFTFITEFLVSTILFFSSIYEVPTVALHFLSSPFIFLSTSKYHFHFPSFFLFIFLSRRSNKRLIPAIPLCLDAAKRSSSALLHALLFKRFGSPFAPTMPLHLQLSS